MRIRYKTCRDCNKTKPIDHFHVNRKISDGRHSYCKLCVKARQQKPGAKAKRKKTRTPERLAWENMRQRCLNPKHPSYRFYGGRGIKICGRWDSFDLFLHDMGERPSPDLSLERHDNEADYEPENCYWATWSEQQINRRRSRPFAGDLPL
jgi:hypothetical protein